MTPRDDPSETKCSCLRAVMSHPMVGNREGVCLIRDHHGGLLRAVLNLQNS
jgi:hypothetical protein